MREAICSPLGRRVRLGIAAGPLLALACLTPELDVQVIQYPGAPPRVAQRGLEECDVDLLAADHFALAGCRDIGDAFVGDTGSSNDCGQARVRRELRRVACRAGADAMVIRPIDDAFTDCFQARARLLVCEEPTEPTAEEGT
jgi:hypothetical protein